MDAVLPDASLGVNLHKHQMIRHGRLLLPYLRCVIVVTEGG